MLEQQDIPQQIVTENTITMKRRITMKTIDSEVLAGYNSGREKGRLHRGIGLIEFERTKEILLEELPSPPAVIYDIGGGYGEYAFWLTSLGYEVYLYDIAEENIRMSDDMARECGLTLKDIIEPEERMLCLKECYRLLKPNGLLFTANITRYSTMIKYVAEYERRPYLDDEDFYNMIANTVNTGVHTKKPMGLAYFHTPEELKHEIETAGFKGGDVRGVIGPCWLIRNLDEVWEDASKRETIMKVVRLLEKEESIMGLSTHFLSISLKH